MSAGVQGASIASIHGSPSPDELVAVTVAVSALVDEAQATAAANAAAGDGAANNEQLNVWLTASRRAAQRSSLSRGPWRISGRIARRSRI